MIELAGLTAIGKELGVSRQGADYLTKQPGFPKPLGKKADNGERIWRMRDVRRYRRTREQRERAKAVDATAEERKHLAAPA